MADENAIASWAALVKVLPKMTEEELRVAINYEVSTYRRKALIKKMHQRYARLHANRLRDDLLAGKVLL